MFKKNVESSGKWYLWLYVGALIICLEGVLLIILYNLGFGEWALTFGTMSLLFGGIALIGVLIYSNFLRSRWRSYGYD
ncbi:MAG: hypothetical protein ACFFCZ_14705 [Promethearchaeota archaeon]